MKIVRKKAIYRIYSAKFPRRIIFAFFTVCIKPQKFKKFGAIRYLQDGRVEAYLWSKCENRAFVRARAIVWCSAMPGHTCVVCRNISSKYPSVSFLRFPVVNDARKARWLHVFDMDESQLKSTSQVGTRHFPNGDSQQRIKATTSVQLLDEPHRECSTQLRVVS